MPAQEFCDICASKFDYIIKLEGEPLELWYLVDKLGLWKDRAAFLKRKNNSTVIKTGNSEVWDYLKELNRDQINFLNEHFAMDLEMFDYKRM